MPQTFKVDTRATFDQIVLVSCAPKMAFGSTNQETAKDGTLKWEIQVLAGFRDGFGAVQNEVVKVGCTAMTDPARGIAPLTKVELVDFEVGVMDRVTRDRDTGQRQMGGAQTWYRVTAIRAATEAADRSRKAEPANA